MNNYDCLLLVTTFVGSIAVFSNYFEELKVKCLEKKGPMSKFVAEFIVFFNYLSMTTLWVILLLLVIYPNISEHPKLYRFINTGLLISLLIITITLIGRWHARGVNYILSKIINWYLFRKAKMDLNKL